jgi:hypothetical protein
MQSGQKELDRRQLKQQLGHTYSALEIESVDDLLQEMVNAGGDPQFENLYIAQSQVTNVVGLEINPGREREVVLAPKSRNLPSNPHGKENTWYTRSLIVFFLFHPQLGNNDLAKASVVFSVPQGT